MIKEQFSRLPKTAWYYYDDATPDTEKAAAF
jgi:hypothetical protein